MKLSELIAFLSCYPDLLDAEVETVAIPSGLRVENLLITEPQQDMFASAKTDRALLHFDDCFTQQEAKE